MYIITYSISIYCTKVPEVSSNLMGIHSLSFLTFFKGVRFVFFFHFSFWRSSSCPQ